jgi:DNA-binding XRE family transcriptional regulator
MRAKRRVSQRRLARACGMPWRDLGRLERGCYHPSWRLLEQLAAALGGTLTALELQVANERYLAEVGGLRALRASVAPRRRFGRGRRRGAQVPSSPPLR